jgi:MerR family transcriptional regulator, thiopeptide resistance regulator
MKMPGLTIGALAKASGLARSTLLYYDRLGLLRPGQRSNSGYRIYSAADARRLEQICLHRKMGISLKEIATLLHEPDSNAPVEILQRRLQSLDRDIAELRRQQSSIVAILKEESIYKGDEMITKERWVEIMRAAGFNEKDMHNWHHQFEKMEPDAHQEFLESLGIKSAEIAKIREYSRKQP